MFADGCIRRSAQSFSKRLIFLTQTLDSYPPPLPYTNFYAKHFPKLFHSYIERCKRFPLVVVAVSWRRQTFDVQSIQGGYKWSLKSDVLQSR